MNINFIFSISFENETTLYTYDSHSRSYGITANINGITLNETTIPLNNEIFLYPMFNNTIYSSEIGNTLSILEENFEGFPFIEYENYEFRNIMRTICQTLTEENINSLFGFYSSNFEEFISYCFSCGFYTNFMTTLFHSIREEFRTHLNEITITELINTEEEEYEEEIEMFNYYCI